MSDMKANEPVKLVIDDLFNEAKVAETLTQLSARDWAQFSKAFKIQEQIQKERVLKEVVDAALANELTPEYLAVRLECFPDLLHIATQHGDLECVKVLIEAEVDIEKNDDEGKTPLTWATYCGETQCLKVLIDAKANIHARGENERAALHVATQQDHPECIELLIEAGAEVDVKDDEGGTPLMLAALHRKLACMTVLLKHGASVWTENNLGETPMSEGLYHGFDNPNNDDTDEDVQATLDMLIQHSPSEDGVTALMCAASHGLVLSVEKLLEMKTCDINAVDKYGTTALMMALGPAGDNRLEYHESDKPGVIALLRGDRTDDEELNDMRRLMMI